MGKLLKWGITAGVALIIGSQLLASVAWVVVSIRMGDYLPFIGISALTLILQRMSVVLKTESKLVRMLVDVLAGSSLLYSFFVVLIALLPFGLVLSIGGAGLYLLLAMLVREPQTIRDAIFELLESTEGLRDYGISLTGSSEPAGYRSLEKQDISILQVSHDHFGTIVQILRKRPMLPVALVHLEDADFLFIRQNEELDWVRQMRRVLQEACILPVTTVSPMLRKILIVYPLLEEAHGIPIADYAIATKPDSVTALLDAMPLRMIVFPSSDGIRIVARKASIPGIDVSPLPSNHLHQIVLGREGGELRHLIYNSEGVLAAH